MNNTEILTQHRTLRWSITDIISMIFVFAVLIGMIWDYVDKQKTINLHNSAVRAFNVTELQGLIGQLENASLDHEQSKYKNHSNLLLENKYAPLKFKTNLLDLEFQIPINNWNESGFLLNKKIYFIDSKQSAQVAWLNQEIKGNEDNILIVNLNGSPSKVSIMTGQNNFFDQYGELAQRFNILSLPAVAEQKGSNIIIKEQRVSFSHSALQQGLYMANYITQDFVEEFSGHLACKTQEDIIQVK